MRAILTGATGYLGGRLVRALLRDGHEVLALVRQTSDTTALEALIGADNVLRYSDDPGSLEALVLASRADAAFHLAAAQQQGSDPVSLRELVSANVLFGGRFVGACAAADIGAFVSAGTFSTHAEGTAEFVPASLYAATKRAFEDVQAFYSASSGMRCVTLELTDTYGPDDPRGKFLRLVSEASAAGTTLDATPGQQLLSLVHADDVAGAFIHTAEGLLGESLVPGTYSVASDELLTLRELVDGWTGATGRTVDVAWGERPYPANQIMRPFVECRLPGWRPAIGLRDGLAQVYGDSAS